jgi:hypothetical protein
MLETYTFQNRSQGNRIKSAFEVSNFIMLPANSPPQWHAVALRKKKEQCDRVRDWRCDNLPAPDVTNHLDFPQRCGLFTEDELRITEKYDATALAEAIREGSLKCVDVTRAFCKVSEHWTCNPSCDYSRRDILITLGVNAGVL